MVGKPERVVMVLWAATCVLAVAVYLPAFGQATALSSAIEAYQGGDHVRAQGLLATVLARDPNNQEANYYLANCLLKDNLKDQAIARYQRCIALGASTLAGRYAAMAVLCLRRGPAGRTANQDPLADDQYESRLRKQSDESLSKLERAKNAALKEAESRRDRDLRALNESALADGNPLPRPFYLSPGSSTPSPSFGPGSMSGILPGVAPRRFGGNPRNSSGTGSGSPPGTGSGSPPGASAQRPRPAFPESDDPAQDEMDRKRRAILERYQNEARAIEERYWTDARTVRDSAQSLARGATSTSGNIHLIERGSNLYVRQYVNFGESSEPEPPPPPVGMKATALKLSLPPLPSLAPLANVKKGAGETAGATKGGTGKRGG